MKKTIPCIPCNLCLFLKRGSIYTLFSALIIVLFSCQQKSTPISEKQKSVVDVVIINPSPLSILVTATGDLLPNEAVEIKAPVTGNVTGIYFEEGSSVKRGEKLITIDDRSWRARLEGLKAALSAARNELNRKMDLLTIEGASEEEVEQAKATVENLEAQINELRVMIDLATVTAPFSGRLGLRNFSMGAYLQQGTDITTLAKINPLKVNFSVPSKYTSKISIGQQLKIISPVTQDTAGAVIYAMDPVISLSNRSLQVKALLEDANHGFVPGDFIQVILEVSENSEALLVPAESVIPELNTHVLYKIQNGKSIRQEITLGNRTPDAVEVLSGIYPGDSVVVTGLLNVQDGQPVQVREIKEQETL